MLIYFKRILEYQLKTQGQFKEEIHLLAHHIGMYFFYGFTELVMSTVIITH